MTTLHTDDSAQLLASMIRGVLESVGSQPVGIERVGVGPLAAIYEDRAAVVGFAVYDEVNQLVSGWLDAQEQLSRALASSLYDMRDKAWDGYLVLGTPQRSSATDGVHLTAIRANTRRVRKLIITGDEIVNQGATDAENMRAAVMRGLAPLLPLNLGDGPGLTDPLMSLSTRMRTPGVQPSLIDAVVDAYRDGRPMLQALHTERLGGTPK